MTKRWLWLMGLLLLAVPARSQMTAVTATVQDANGQHYVNCSWSVVFVGQNTIPGAGPYQPAALLVGQQGTCNSSGVLTVSLADNIATVRPTPSQWNFSICSAPGYIPGGTYCRSNMLVTITGASQNLTSFFQPLMPLLPSGGGGGGSQYITDATPLGGLMRTGSTLGLQTTCIAGQYLGWNGSAWACTTPGGGGVNSGTLVTVNGTQAVPNQLNFNSTSPLPPAGSQNVVFQLNGNSVSGYVPTGGGGGGSLTVNGATGGSDLNDILPPFPPNGINISWQAANGHISGAIVGDGIATHCFLGTGVFAQCPGSGAAGVSSINNLTGALTFTGAVSCSGATCNFTGGGAGGLPTIPQYNLFASTGAGGAQDSTIKAGPPGFLQAEVVTATGDITSAAAPFQLFPNAGVEYFPTGYAWSGGTAGATNGLAMYMSHSSGSTASANGGVALGGGNSSSTGNQVYLDCETSGCDFKVAPTYLGASIGGGGGSGTVASGTGNYFAWYPSTGTTVNSNSNLSDNGALITSQEPIAAPGINVTGSGGIAMTGAGGTLPAPVLNQGGIGIGPGNVPQFYSNGGAWTAIGSGGGGTAGVSSINGTAGAFTFSGAGVSCATTTCTFTGSGSGTTVSINGTSPGSTLNLTNTATTPLTNGHAVSWTAPASGASSAYLVGDGNTSHCLLGNGTFGACPGGGTSVPLVRTSQVCQADSSAAAAPVSIVLSGLIVNAGDTVVVAIGTYNSTPPTYTVSDSAGNTYTQQAIQSRSQLWTSPVGVSQSVTSVTVTRTSTPADKFIACVVDYAGVTAIGVTGTNSGLSGTVPTGTLNVSAAGHIMLMNATAGSSVIITINPGTQGTPIVAGGSAAAGTATTAGNTAMLGLCENTAPAAGSLTCNFASLGAAWATTSIELVGGASGNGTSPRYSCTIAADAPFTTTTATICSQALGTTAKQWIVHCNLPFNFTSGTGTANIGINLTATPSFQTYITTMLGAAAGPTYGSVAVSASGNTQMITRAVTDATLYTLTLDGTIVVPANTTFSVYGTTTAGTAAFRPGVACVLQ